MVEQLGRYGPRKMVLVDPETVDEPSRSRIPGTRPPDVGRLKTEVLMHAAGMAYRGEQEPCEAFELLVGRGDIDPLLDMPHLSRSRRAA